MFHRKKKSSISMSYDPNVNVPVIRCSICTGEQVAGFKDLSDGRFEEVMLIRSSADLEEFRERYGITGDIEKIY
ncbi:MAG TPA: aspartate dehydrogenase [Candidatus Mediterraneibacter stercoripullorum]|nr:aspartate dehydrogenase [Candidatus Mediterraneibacter stercoripullorum]